MNFEQIKEKCEDLDQKVLSTLIYEDDPKYTVEERKKFEEVVGLPFEFVVCRRTEGDGDYNGWEWVWKVGDVYCRLEGWYDSNNGADCGSIWDFEEVKPVKVEVTEYKPV